MLYTSFKNYEEFKQLFPIREYNGVSTRQNKILLSLYKSGRWFFHSPLRSVRSMPELEQRCFELLQSGSTIAIESEEVNVMDYHFSSSSMHTDERNGICEDGDVNQVRVYMYDDSSDRYKLCKRKVGKFLRTLITESSELHNLPEQVINYLCEQFTSKWKAHVLSNRYELHVDTCFNKIYDGNLYDGSFGSCMTSNGHHTFYSRHLENAKAAYIMDRNSGLMAARAVIFDAEDVDGGRHWRLCERQYATTGSRNDALKRILVDMLIAGDFIDGYKTVGADCHNATNFVDVNGNSIADKTFRIKCVLPPDNKLSYQDSFKWYYPLEGYAYNRMVSSGSVNLASTGRSVSISLNWSSYKNCYFRGSVYYGYKNGERVSFGNESANDFVLISGARYHHEDVLSCRISGRLFVKYPGSIHSGCYCAELDEWFHDSHAREEAIRLHSEQNYVECVDDNTRHDPADCFHSELLNAYFWIEENLERAEAASATNVA